VAQYYLDFGDGTISGWTAQSVIDHSYIAPGNYTIYLLVRDEKGAISKSSSRTTVTVTDSPSKATLSSPTATLVVLVLFVALMVVGTIYEVRRSRLGGAGYGVGPPVEGRAPTAGTSGRDRAVGAAPPAAVMAPSQGRIGDGASGGVPAEGAAAASVGAHDIFEPVHEGTGSWPKPATPSPTPPAPSEEVELVPVEEGRGAPPGTALPGMLRVTCMGCGSILTLQDGPRPIRVACGRCGRGGVIR
jgi:PKD repeat protein